MFLTVCVYLYYPGGGGWYYINIFVPDLTPGTEFPTPYFMVVIVLNCLRGEVVVRYVDIGGNC